MSAPSLSDLLWERKVRKYRGQRGDVESMLAGFELFCREQVYIQHPKGRRLFELREAQIETARAYMESDEVIVLKARQIGFTTLTMVLCLWYVLFHDDFAIINISRKEDDAKDALRKAAFAYDNLDPRLRARLPQRIDDNRRRLSFENGSYIESHPSADNPARGRTVALIILDELAFMPSPEDAWASVKPVTDIGGRVIALSTANGYGNLFQRLWGEAELGTSSFRGVFFPWSAVPERDEAWYETQKRSMLPWQLAQEYPTSPDEAFIRSGNPVFDVDALRELRPWAPNTYWLDAKDARYLKQFEWVAGDGPLSVYEEPVRYESYVIGADVAQGLEHGDYSSAHVINARTGLVAAHWHGSIDPDDFGRVLARLGWWYGNALIGVESNNHGLTTLKALQRTKYERIYFRRRYTSRREQRTEELGWYTSRTTKPMLVDDLGAALRDETVQVFDKPTIGELLMYVRKDDGTTSGSPHDDRVMSLGIALQMVKHAASPEQQARTSVQFGTWDYYFRQLQESDRPDSSWVLGKRNQRDQGQVLTKRRPRPRGR